MGRLNWTEDMRNAARARRTGRLKPSLTLEGLPTDFVLRGGGSNIGFSATCKTSQEIDGVIFVLRHMRPTLPPASVGRNAERQDHEDGLGPKDEHAVPEGETPQ